MLVFAYERGSKVAGKMSIQVHHFSSDKSKLVKDLASPYHCFSNGPNRRAFQMEMKMAIFGKLGKPRGTDDAQIRYFARGIETLFSQYCGIDQTKSGFQGRNSLPFFDILKLYLFL